MAAGSTGAAATDAGVGAAMAAARGVTTAGAATGSGADTAGPLMPRNGSEVDRWPSAATRA